MDEDWRVTNQAQYLQGASLVRRAYRVWSETWEHDHCEFCLARFVEAGSPVADDESVQIEGYAALGTGPNGRDDYHWVCEGCFSDFREPFAWIELVEANDFEVIDGLAAQRLGHEGVFESEQVRVRATPETEAAGYAGLVGEIMGETQPSASRVQVVGTSEEDYAINVWFEGRREQAWFAPHLVEPVTA